MLSRSWKSHLISSGLEVCSCIMRSGSALTLCLCCSLSCRVATRSPISWYRSRAAIASLWPGCKSSCILYLNTQWSQYQDVQAHTTPIRVPSCCRGAKQPYYGKNSIKLRFWRHLVRTYFIYNNLLVVPLSKVICTVQVRERRNPSVVLTFSRSFSFFLARASDGMEAHPSSSTMCMAPSREFELTQVLGPFWTGCTGTAGCPWALRIHGV